ncbi:hypothetical protein N7513_012310 [Penicillium frequentans]|nr:hypothetical protein N7513_012310 [Penicillium glabrum]
MVKFSNIPTSSQWITFPVSAKNQVPINWEDDRNKYENTYHVAKCYYGILEDLVPAPSCVVDDKLDVPNPVIYTGEGKLTIMGETKIFIAAEFFEEEYSRSPSDLAHFHLKDIARKIVGSKNLKESPWVTMKLNGAFCYGQSYGVFGVRRRYIVYHPSVGPGIRLPKIHQHRFTDTEISDALMKGLEGSAKKLPEKYKPMGSLLSQLGKLVHSTGQATIGDYLKVFLDDLSLTEADKNCPELEFLGNEKQLRERLEQIQTLEFRGSGRKAKNLKRNNLLAPPSNKPASSEQLEEVPDIVHEENDQELAGEKLRQQMENVLVKIEECTEGLKENEEYGEEEGEEAERDGQDNSEETRKQVIGHRPRRVKSLVGDNTGEQSSEDTSVLAILSYVRSQPQVIVTTKVPGQKSVKKRIAEFRKSPIDQHDLEIPGQSDNKKMPLAKSDHDSNKLAATESFVHPEQNPKNQKRPDGFRSPT